MSAAAYPAGTERNVEIPWSLARYADCRRVLEVGCSFASENPKYIEGLRALKIPELHGIDISAEPAPDFIKRTADIRASGYPSEFFETVFCISTLEHVGRDNARHYNPVAELKRDGEPDVEALREMLRVTTVGGRVIITVPFGRLQDHGWFLNYDAENIDRLFRDVDLSEEAYFRFTPEGWFPCSADELTTIGYRDNGAPAAAGLGCFLIVKK